MCQSMVNIQSPTAEIRRGKKRKKKEERRRNRMKIYMVFLLHRATINNKHQTLKSLSVDKPMNSFVDKEASDKNSGSTMWTGHLCKEGRLSLACAMYISNTNKYKLILTSGEKLSPYIANKTRYRRFLKLRYHRKFQRALIYNYAGRSQHKTVCTEHIPEVYNTAASSAFSYDF